MMIQRTLCIVGLLLGLGGSAFADDAYDACMNASDGTNPAWAQCGGDWVKREDTALNVMWGKLRAATTGQSSADLLAEQRAWNTYKEASCAFLANGDFGREGQVVHYPACRAAVIAARTAELGAYLQQFNQ